MNVEAVPQFLDSNVLVYAYDLTAGQKNKRARKLVEALWASQQGHLSVQILQEFYVTVTRKLARPLASSVAAQIVADMANWQTHRPDAQDILGAIQIHQRFGISFWDAMVLRSAESLGCRLLWSEDLNAGQRYGDVQVRNPFA